VADKLARTVKAIDKLTPEPTRARIHYFEGDTRGFAIQVTPNGTKTFLLCYVAKATGRERRMVIGPYGKAPALSLSAALAKAQELRALVNAGKDPWQDEKAGRAHAVAERMAKGATLGSLLEAYCEALERAKKPSAAGVRRELRSTIETPFPSLWKRQAAMVTLDDLVKPLNRLTRAGKHRQAQKTRSYLRAAYTMAAGSTVNAAVSDLFEPFAKLPNIGRDLATIDQPGTDANDPDATDDPGKRALSQPELAAYWNRIKAMDDATGALLRFHLLTGAQRGAQLARLTAASVDGDVVTILDRKGRRTKARRHSVPLLPEAAQALQAMRGDAGPYVFSLDSGRTGAGYHALRRKVGEVAALMVAAKETSETFTPGELRITVETRLQAAGVSQEIRAQLQSHGLGGIQNKHYAKHEFATEKLEALETLRALCEPVPDNVTPINSRKGKNAAKAA
jgi:integrase